MEASSVCLSTPIGGVLRNILTLIAMLYCSSAALATEVVGIKPGMSLKDVKSVLQMHGYEVDAKKFGMAMASDDKDVELEFCPIDSGIVLIIDYKVSTGMVVSMSVFSFPTGPRQRRTGSFAALAKSYLTKKALSRLRSNEK